MTTYEKIDVKVEEIVEYEKNARIHSEEQIGQIINSIKTFGFTNPILIDENNNLIAGHGRLKSIKKINEDGGIDGELVTTIPAIVITGLTEAQRRALVIADNKIALNSTWDYELLTQELVDLQEELDDISILGFSDKEMKTIFAEVEDATSTMEIEQSELLVANLTYKKYKIPMNLEEAEYLAMLIEEFKIKETTLAGFVREYILEKNTLKDNRAGGDE